MELDSSTASKFSRHLILPCPGHAFADNRHVGAFVSALLQPVRPKVRCRAGMQGGAGCLKAGSHTSPARESR